MTQCAGVFLLIACCVMSSLSLLLTDGQTELLEILILHDLKKVIVLSELLTAHLCWPSDFLDTKALSVVLTLTLSL